MSLSRPLRLVPHLLQCRQTLSAAGRQVRRRCAATQATNGEPQRQQYAAAVLREYDRPLSLELRTEPLKCAEGQVLVKVDSAGLNSSDHRLIAGVHYLKPKPPIVPGFELAGEVVDAGAGVTSVQPGDRVLGLLSESTGSLSELCLVPIPDPVKCQMSCKVSRLLVWDCPRVDEHNVHALPHSVTYEKALCLPISYASAYHALANVAKVNEGDYVLVVTSQGGTGLAAIDVALNVFRCNVIVASDEPAKLDMARSMGVLATADYMNEKMPSQVRQLTNGDGAHVVIDTVNSFWFDLALKSLRPRGHLLVTGFSSNSIPMVSLQDLYKHQVTVSGVWFGGFARAHSSKFNRMLDMLIELSEDGYISPSVAHKYPLHEINKAVAFSRDSKPLGKFVITCRDFDRSVLK